MTDDQVIPAFSYVTAEKAWLYRRVMRVFSEAKASFVLHLRPVEVAQAYGGDGGSVIVDPAELDRALQQLCEWGNLQRHFDTREVLTVREFQ